MTRQEFLIRRRSWFGRLMHFPSVFRAHYRLLRKFCGPLESFRAAWALNSLLLKRIPFPKENQ